jgi:chromosome segregation ATPase
MLKLLSNESAEPDGEEPADDPNGDLSPEDLRLIQDADFYERASPLVQRLASACLEQRNILARQVAGATFESLRCAERALKKVQEEISEQKRHLFSFQREKADLADEVARMRRLYDEQFEEIDSLNNRLSKAQAQREKLLAGEHVIETRRILRRALKLLSPSR